MADDSLLPQIVRQGSGLAGTRPFWTNKGGDLQAHARFLSPSTSPVFVTFSAADMQWQDLHRRFPGFSPNLTPNDPAGRVWDRVHDHPHLIAHYLLLRFEAFVKHVLRPSLGFADYWYRFEWQARGSGHEHCLFWIPSAPSMNCGTDESRAEFARYWGARITAWNPDPLRSPDVCNPVSLAWADVANTADQFAAFLNHLQMHSTCRVPYCLRPKRGSLQPPTYRFFFPRPLFTDAVVTRDINRKGWMFSPARN